MFVLICVYLSVKSDTGNYLAGKCVCLHGDLNHRAIAVPVLVEALPSRKKITLKSQLDLCLLILSIMYSLCIFIALVIADRG